MFKFAISMAITALVIYIASAVLNQSYDWANWSYIVQSVWEFVLFFGAFHYYRKSIYTWFVWDLVFLSLIGFASINFSHSVYSISIWALSENEINDILAESFEEYNFLFMTFACVPVLGAVLIYLINLPYLLNRK